MFPATVLQQGLADWPSQVLTLHLEPVAGMPETFMQHQVCPHPVRSDFKAAVLYMGHKGINRFFVFSPTYFPYVRTYM